MKWEGMMSIFKAQNKQTSLFELDLFYANSFLFDRFSLAKSAKWLLVVFF